MEPLKIELDPFIQGVNTRLLILEYFMEKNGENGEKRKRGIEK